MVSRDQLLKYGALLLIAVFVGETIFLGLSNASSSNPNGGATPTPVSFSGVVNTSGRVTQLGYSALVVCDASTGLDRELKSMPGVRAALFASSTVLALQFDSNESAVVAAESLVADRCSAPLFRSAGVDLPSQVYVNTSSGEQAVPSRQLDAYFSSQGVNGFQAFVSPALQVGDALNVTISIVVQDNQFVSVTAQQPEADVLALWLSRAFEQTAVTILGDGDASANATANASGRLNGSAVAAVSNASTPLAVPAFNASDSNRSE